MNQRDYLEVKQKMKIKGLPFEWQRLNVIRHHNRHESGETWKHFFCKAIMGKILYDADRNYFSEYEFPNKAVVDILDVTTMTAIEFETNYSDRKEKLKLVNFMEYTKSGLLNDVIVINISDMPNDLVSIEQYLRKRVGL